MSKCDECEYLGGTLIRCDCLERFKDRIQGMDMRHEDRLKKGSLGEFQTELNEIRLAFHYLLKVIETRKLR
jgi:hypothetical protein